MRNLAIFSIFIIFQMFFLFSAFDYLMILLTAVSLVFYALFACCMIWISSIMKLVEYAVSVSCRKYLTEDRVPDLGMDPVPNEQIDEKSDELIENIVRVIRKKEGIIQTLLKKAAKMKASSLVEDLKEFQQRQEYEQVKEKELVHFMAEWKSKSMAEIFCRVPVLLSYVAAIGIIAVFITSVFFRYFV